MRRSSEFGLTVKYGTRTAQPDLVVHVRRTGDQDAGTGPRVGLIVGKSVGSAVARHRVSRRLRHAARMILDDLDPSDRLVIRALPGSLQLSSVGMEHQLRRGLRRSWLRAGSGR